MFTGIIEEVGTVSAIDPISGGKRFTFFAEKVLSDLKIGDSIAISGVCLTCVDKVENYFKAEAVGDTLLKTSLNRIRLGDKVNLERALRPSDRLGGHFVQGHVNGVGRVRLLKQLGENWELKVEIPGQLKDYIIPEGSIAIDGVSLTIAGIDDTMVRISVIPHTYENTIISSYQNGQELNIETDFLGKYVEKFVRKDSHISKITEPWLRSLGY